MLVVLCIPLLLVLNSSPISKKLYFDDQNPEGQAQASIFVKDHEKEFGKYSMLKLFRLSENEMKITHSLANWSVGCKICYMSK